MRNPWRKFKYVLLFMNMFFAVMQGFFLYANLAGENPSGWLLLIQSGFMGWFFYWGISNFKEHCRLDRAWQVIDQDLERVLAELTIRYEEYRMGREEYVNWKRDGF